MSTSHAKTNADLIKIRTGTDRVKLNLRCGESITCHTDHHHKIAELVTLVLDVNARLRREIDEDFAARGVVLSIRPDRLDQLDAELTRAKVSQPDPFDCGLLYGSPEPWESFEVPLDHPDGCGCAQCVNVALVSARDDAIFSGPWTPGDDRRPA